MPSRTRAAPHPVLSSPKRLAFMGFGVTLLTYAVQIASGIPPFLSWSPVELSSNVVAMAGLVWALIQLRASWREASLKRAWIMAAAGMAILTVEGDLGVFLLGAHGQSEMTLSIGLWLLAAALMFSAASRFASRRSVRMVMAFAFAVQLVAQFVGWWVADRIFSVAAAEFYEYFHDTGELFAVLAYLSAFLLLVFSAQKTYDFPVSAIGRKSREIFRDLPLSRPGGGSALATALRLPAVRQLSTLAAVVVSWRREAGAAHAAGGPAPRTQLCQLLRFGLIENVDPGSYYGLELYRAPGVGAAADAVMTTGAAFGFDQSIERMRAGLALPAELDDRARFARRCAEGGLAAAPLLAVLEDGALHLGAGGEGALDRDLVVRDRFAAAGETAMTFERVEPMLFRDEEDNLLNADMLLSRLSAGSRERGLVVTPRLDPHGEIAGFARRSRVVFRLVTCLDEADEPRVTHGLMLIAPVAPGRPSPAGRGWGAAIDIATGRYGGLVGEGGRRSGARLFAHPVTREMIAGRDCSGWPDLMRTVVEAHRVFAGHVMIGWDLAWTPDGPRILDASANLDFGFIQRCYGTPIGFSPLAPLLDAHLDRVVADRL